jgi:hypothetical protein
MAIIGPGSAAQAGLSGFANRWLCAIWRQRFVREFCFLARKSGGDLPAARINALALAVDHVGDWGRASG